MVSPKASWGNRDARDHLGSAGQALGTRRTYHPGGRPAQGQGPQARCPTADAQRHHLPAAQRMPMEPIAETAPFIAPFNGGWDGCLAPNGGALVEGCEELDGVDAERLARPFWGDLGPTRRMRIIVGLWLRRARCQALTGPIVVRPAHQEEPQHLCLDKGYDNPSGRGAAAGHGFEHIRRIVRRSWTPLATPARRWVVEDAGMALQVPWVLVR